jgi:tight adherence protein C
MSDETLRILAFAATFGALALALGYVALTSVSRRQISRSLAAVSGAGAGSLMTGDPTSAPLADRLLAPGFGRLVALGRRFSPDGIAARITRRLDLAGNPGGWTVERILGYKGLGLVAGAGLGIMLGARRGPFVAILFTALGGLFCFFLPDILVYNAGTKRQQKIQKSLPDAMDLLTISVEAGLGFDAALAQVARNTEGPLAGEFFRVLQEMQIGKGRSESLRAMGDRTDAPELRSFVASMVQAEVFGIPIANVLRTQAKEMRIKRQQRAEELAMKVPVKIMVPLVLFILPALFVVIIGPGALSIIDTFSK